MPAPRAFKLCGGSQDGTGVVVTTSLETVANGWCVRSQQLQDPPPTPSIAAPCAVCYHSRASKTSFRAGGPSRLGSGWK